MESPDQEFVAANEADVIDKPEEARPEEKEEGLYEEKPEDLVCWYWNSDGQALEDPETRRIKFLRCIGYACDGAPGYTLQENDNLTEDNLLSNEEETWSISSVSSCRDLSPPRIDSQIEVEDFLEELHNYDSDGSGSDKSRSRISKRSVRLSRAGKTTKVELIDLDASSELEENDEWRTLSEFGEPFPQFISRLYKLGNIDMASENVKDDSNDRLSSDSDTEYIKGNEKAENSSGWARLCLLPDPWAEARYPTEQFISREELAKEYMSKSLNMTTIASGLGNLSVPPGHTQYTCTKLQLQGLGIESIEELSNYKYLQYIDIGMNSIVDLSPIWSVHHLVVLDASNNLISEHTFGQPQNILFLTYLSLSHNKFTKIPDLSPCWSLKHLNLSQNKIQFVENLESLEYLEYLDLSSNELETIANLRNPNLVEVNFSRNQLKQWDNPSPNTLRHLKKVNVSHNSFETLKTFKNMYSLRILNASKNEFHAMTDFDWLKTLPRLEDLRLYGNKLMSVIQDARRLIIYYLPALKKLDNSPITSMERVSSRSLYSKCPMGSISVDDTLSFYHSRCRNTTKGWEDWKPAGDHPALVLLVSYIGCSCNEIAWKVFQKNPYKVKIVKQVTTLPKAEKDSFSSTLPSMKHVSPEEFYEREENGEFVLTYLLLGYNFGLESVQLEAKDKVLLTVVNLSAAQVLLWRGFNPYNVLLCTESDEIFTSRLYSWYRNTKFFKSDSHTSLARRKMRKRRRRSTKHGKSRWRIHLSIAYRSISGAGVSAMSEIEERRLSRRKQNVVNRKKRIHRMFTSVKVTPHYSHHKKKKMQKSPYTHRTTGYGGCTIPIKQYRPNYFWDPIFQRNTEHIFTPGLSQPISEEWCTSQERLEKKRVGFSVSEEHTSSLKSIPSRDASGFSAYTKDTGALSSAAFALEEREEFARFAKNIYEIRMLYREMNRKNPGFFHLYLPSDDTDEAARILNEFVEEKYEKLSSVRDSEVLLSDSPYFNELVMSLIDDYVDEVCTLRVPPDIL